MVISHFHNSLIMDLIAPQEVMWLCPIRSKEEEINGLVGTYSCLYVHMVPEYICP